ncbi:MAG: aminotransferase class V-fold PLP-dependent enzyme [Bacillota bacterium]
MIYFDACATGGKKADCVFEACKTHLENIANAGRSGHKIATQNGIILREFRELIADSFALDDASRIVITKNCSEALNLGILGTIEGLKKGKIKPHIIASALDHNSVLRPLYHLKSKGDIELTILYPQGGNGLTTQDVKKAIRKNTRLVCLNLVSNVTGGQTDVCDIAKYLSNLGILTLCDGAQGLGHIDFSAENIDILCAPMHKALGGVMGVGFCGFSKRVKPVPIAFGGTGTNSNSLYQGVDFPESFEVGTLNMLGICASRAGLEHKMTNFSKSQKKVAHLNSHLRSFKFPNLVEYSVPNECGIFSFLIDGLDSAEIANILSEKYDIASRGGLTCAPLMHRHLGTEKSGILRISFDEFNTHKEIETLAKALFEIAK